MDSYGARSLESASGVDLVIALYDGIIRFMHRAIDAVEANDAGARRAAVKRAMDIVLHLQATLRHDVGGKPAACLSEFYVAMFALMLQGSTANSRTHFEQVIACVANVRDAWRQVAADPSVRKIASEPATGLPHPAAVTATQGTPDSEVASSWTA